MSQDLAAGIDDRPRMKGDKIIVGMVCWGLSSFHQPMLINYIQISKPDTEDKFLRCLNQGYTLREHTRPLGYQKVPTEQ